MKRKKSKPITLAQANKRLIKQGPSPMAKVVIGLEQTNGRVNQISDDIENLSSKIDAVNTNAQEYTKAKVNQISSDVDLAVAKVAEFTATIKSITDKLDRRLKKMEKNTNQATPLESIKANTDALDRRITRMENANPATAPIPEISRGHQLAKKVVNLKDGTLRIGGTGYTFVVRSEPPVNEDSIDSIRDIVAMAFNAERHKIIDFLVHRSETGYSESAIYDLKTGADYRDDQ